MYIYVYMYEYIHIHILYACICIYVYMYEYIHIHILYACICIYIYTCMNTYISYTHSTDPGYPTRRTVLDVSKKKKHTYTHSIHTYEYADLLHMHTYTRSIYTYAYTYPLRMHTCTRSMIPNRYVLTSPAWNIHVYPLFCIQQRMCIHLRTQTGQ